MVPAPIGTRVAQMFRYLKRPQEVKYAANQVIATSAMVRGRVSVVASSPIMADHHSPTLPCKALNFVYH